MFVGSTAWAMTGSAASFRAECRPWQRPRAARRYQRELVAVDGARVVGEQVHGGDVERAATPAVAREEAESLLLAGLAGLSEDHRRVLELRYLKGCRLTDIAATMDRSPAAVQMLCGRAMRELRAAIQQISGIRP